MTIPSEPILYIVLAFLVYSPSLFGPFIFDDRSSTIENNSVRRKKPEKAIRVRWRGLTVFTWCVQYCMAVVEANCPHCGKGQAAVKPWSFRAGNILLHGLNAWGVGAIAGLLGLDPMIAAMFFVVGPFAVYGVSYITGRPSILSASFGILGVWAILSGYELWAVPALGLAFWAKEDGVGYGGTFLLVSWLSGGYWWAWAVPSIIIIGWHWNDIKRVTSDTESGSENMVKGGLPGSLDQPEHGFTQFTETLIHYPMWAFGFKQAPYHGSGMSYPSAARSIPAGMMFGLWVTVLILQPDLRISVALLLTGPWMLYIVVPTMDVLMEYRNYFSAVGVALLFAALPIVVAVPLACFLAVMTWANAHATGNPIQFWQKCITSGSGEKSRAWQEWGNSNNEAGRVAEARYGYEKALEINPGFSAPRTNLAWVDVREGRLKEALEGVAKAAKHCPLQWGAWMDYGNIAEINGDLPLAAKALRTCVALKPDSHQNWNQLGMVQFKRKQYPSAREAFGKARFINPRQAEYVWNWAWASKYMGKEKEAKAAMQLLPKEIPMTNTMVDPPEAKKRMGA